MIAALSYARGRISSTGLPVDFIERPVSATCEGVLSRRRFTEDGSKRRREAPSPKGGDGSDWFPLHQQRNFLYTDVLEAPFIGIRKGLIIFIHVLFPMIAEFSNVLFFGSTAADAAVTSRPCGPQ